MIGPFSVELLLAFTVYGYMNGAIFKVFGAAILIFELLLVLIFVLGLPRIGRGPRDFGEIMLLFFGFLVVTTVIAVGLIRLHRWAAITASTLGLFWSLTLASSLGHAPWQSLFVGIPVVFGMLLPLYATVRNWSSLRPVGEGTLKPFLYALRSSDRLHLE